MSFEGIDYAPSFPEVKRDFGIAVVGAGAIVQAAHLPAYQANGLRVTGIFDANEQHADEVARRFGLDHVYPALDALLADPSVQIVDIAVPSWYQRDILERALQAGKHVLCQKPLAPSWDEACETARLAQSFPTKVAVNQQMRWTPGVRYSRALIERGAIGQPLNAWFQVSVNTDWTQWPWIVPLDPMLTLYNTIHLVDSMRFLFGSPVSVYAQMGKVEGQDAKGETRLLLAMRYESGLVAFIHDHHTNPSPDRYAAFRFEGDGGYIGGTVGIWYNYPTGRADTLRYWSSAERDTTRDVQLEGKWAPDAFAGPMADLMWAIVQDTTPPTGVEDNLDTLRVCFGAVRSAREDRVVALREL